MLAVIFHCTGLVIIIMSCNCQNGNVDPLVLLWWDRYLVPIFVRMGVGNPGLEEGGCIADNMIKFTIRKVILVHFLEFLNPKFGVVHNGHIAGNPTGVCLPLHLIWRKNI